MKKIMILATAAMFVLGGATSCKKVRDCNCSNAAYSTPIPKGKKSDQKNACDAIQAAAQLIDPGVTCSLK